MYERYGTKVAPIYLFAGTAFEINIVIKYILQGMKLLLSVLKRNEEPYVREKNRS